MNEQGMPPGLKGIVKSVDDAGQLHMIWENGRSLALVPGAGAADGERGRKGNAAGRNRRNGAVKKAEAADKGRSPAMQIKTKQ